MTLRVLLPPWRHTGNQVAELSVPPDAVNGNIVFDLPGRVVDGAAAATEYSITLDGVKGEPEIEMIQLRGDLKIPYCLRMSL